MRTGADVDRKAAPCEWMRATARTQSSLFRAEGTVDIASGYLWTRTLKTRVAVGDSRLRRWEAGVSTKGIGRVTLLSGLDAAAASMLRVHGTWRGSAVYQRVLYVHLIVPSG